jgi:hypothetical protein
MGNHSWAFVPDEKINPAIKRRTLSISQGFEPFKELSLCEERLSLWSIVFIAVDLLISNKLTKIVSADFIEMKERRDEDEIAPLLPTTISR